jgi:hypothetical protein
MKLEERKPYYFTDKGIAQIESMRNATYMGYWCGKTKDGQWAERPLDVFYQADPDVEAGHSNYFGLIVNPATNQVLIADAKSCFAQPIAGIVEEGVVYASRYRHDMVITPSGGSVDGGRDYTKTGASPTLVNITVSGDTFEFSEIEDKSDDEGDRHLDDS